MSDVIEVGIHTVRVGHVGWKADLVCFGDAGRELLRVDDAGVSLAGDLTLDEARTLLTEMAGNYVAMSKGSR